MSERLYNITESEIVDIVRRAALAVVVDLRENLHPSREVMTKAQVAKYLGRSIATVDRWMLKGMPFQKEGNDHPTFIRKDVDYWLRTRN